MIPFNGSDYVHVRDVGRLTEQMGRVKAHMADGGWHTLNAIATATGDPAPSVSAQLRHLRKPRFGSHNITKRYVGDGLYEYRMETA